MKSLRTHIVAATLGATCLAIAPAVFAADTVANDASATSSTASAKALNSKAFVTTAAADGLFEVEAGKLATERASNPDVKAFAERMVTDHSAANEKLEALAKAQNIAVPKKLDAKHEAKLTALKSHNGADFDTAYVKDMTEGHHKAVALFTSAASSPDVDPSLKDFATKTLPTLQDHNSKVQQLRH